MESDRPLVITLEKVINVPAATKVFRARERSRNDETTVFFGTNIMPEECVIEVHNDNIRAVSDTTGSETVDVED
jgi:hypothetical protein